MRDRDQRRKERRTVHGTCRVGDVHDLPVRIEHLEIRFDLAGEILGFVGSKGRDVHALGHARSTRVALQPSLRSVMLTGTKQQWGRATCDRRPRDPQEDESPMSATN